MIKRKTITRLPHEVFEQLEKSKSKQERVEILKNGTSIPIKLILQCAFSKSIIFDLPEGAPPYRQDKNPAGLQQTSLKQAIQILTRLTTNNVRLNRFRKEKLFIQLLETVHAKDAVIIIAAKDKTLHELYPLLTESLVVESFPEFKL
jgi:hypothetical protein